MKIKEYIPKSLVDYLRLIRNKRKYPNRNILTPYLFGSIELGNKVSLGKNVYLYSGVSIGDHSYVHGGTIIVSGTIGKYCSIAYNNQIGMWEHPTNFISTSPKTYSYGNVFGFDNLWEHPEAPVIGNDVWIGSNVIVMRGITIGDGAIIGSGAIVTKDIPDYAIAVGSPAKVIRYRFDDETIKVLKELKWWDLPQNELMKYIDAFKMGEDGPSEILKRIQNEKIG